MNKPVIKTVQIPENSADVPNAPEFRVDHFCIGRTTREHTYLERGNTRIGTTNYYDFGYGVENKAPHYMRVNMTLESIGKDEYAAKKYYAWKDVAPGTKARVWANLDYKDKDTFNFLRISEIAFGKTPANNSDGAVWTAITKPNKRIGPLLQVQAIRKPISKTNIILWVVIALLASCLLPYIFFFLFI